MAPNRTRRQARLDCLAPVAFAALGFGCVAGAAESSDIKRVATEPQELQPGHGLEPLSSTLAAHQAGSPEAQTFLFVGQDRHAGPNPDALGSRADIALVVIWLPPDRFEIWSLDRGLQAPGACWTDSNASQSSGILGNFYRLAGRDAFVHCVGRLLEDSFAAHDLSALKAANAEQVDAIIEVSYANLQSILTTLGTQLLQMPVLAASITRIYGGLAYSPALQSELTERKRYAAGSFQRSWNASRFLENMVRIAAQGFYTNPNAMMRVLRAVLAEASRTHSADELLAPFARGEFPGAHFADICRGSASLTLRTTDGSGTLLTYRSGEPAALSGNHHFISVIEPDITLPHLAPFTPCDGTL